MVGISKKSVPNTQKIETHEKLSLEEDQSKLLTDSFVRHSAQFRVLYLLRVIDYLPTFVLTTAFNYYWVSQFTVPFYCRISSLAHSFILSPGLIYRVINDSKIGKIFD